MFVSLFRRYVFQLNRQTRYAIRLDQRPGCRSEYRFSHAIAFGKLHQHTITTQQNLTAEDPPEIRDAARYDAAEYLCAHRSGKGRELLRAGEENFPSHCIAIARCPIEQF